MFRDRKEELDRLESALLEQEEEDTLPEEAAEDFDDGYDPVSDYDAYNTDISDEDLDAFSDAVYSPKRSRASGLLVVIFILLTAIFCVLLWWILRSGGYL